MMAGICGVILAWRKELGRNEIYISVIWRTCDKLDHVLYDVVCIISGRELKTSFPDSVKPSTRSPRMLHTLHNSSQNGREWDFSLGAEAKEGAGIEGLRIEFSLSRETRSSAVAERPRNASFQ